MKKGFPAGHRRKLLPDPLKQGHDGCVVADESRRHFQPWKQGQQQLYRKKIQSTAAAMGLLHRMFKTSADVSSAALAKSSCAEKKSNPQLQPWVYWTGCQLKIKISKIALMACNSVPQQGFIKYF